MKVELGTIGVWRRATAVTPQFARQVEQLGYGAMWLGGSPRGDLGDVDTLLEATERIPVVTGIVNMWRDDAGTVGKAYQGVTERHPGRFLLGVGIGHPEGIKEYRRPYQKIVEYLDQLDEAGVPASGLVLAALGPRVLALAGERTAGAHPYLTTPRHTSQARRILGEGPLLAPEQKVLIETDPELARSVGRPEVSRYLRLLNYRSSLIREGWVEEDLADGGSDRLINQLVLHGNPEVVAGGVRAHLQAGADHVSIQALGDEPLEAYRRLAGLLIG